MRPTPTLRGEVLARYASDWLLDLQDIFDFVREPNVALRAGIWQRSLREKKTLLFCAHRWASMLGVSTPQPLPEDPTMQPSTRSRRRRPDHGEHLGKPHGLVVGCSRSWTS